MFGGLSCRNQNLLLDLQDLLRILKGQILIVDMGVNNQDLTLIMDQSRFDPNNGLRMDEVLEVSKTLR